MFGALIRAFFGPPRKRCANCGMIQENNWAVHFLPDGRILCQLCGHKRP